MGIFQLDLFERPDGTVVVAKKPSTRPRLVSGWQLADHACQHCFGRILQRAVKGEVVEVRCAECGKRADGPPEMLCCCGADCGDLGFVLQCVRNPKVTNEVPHEIMVREKRIAPTEQRRHAGRPVKLKDF